MISIDIDKPSSFELSNVEIYESLKHLFFSSKENYGLEKFAAIAGLIQLITSKELLDEVIQFLAKHGYDFKNTSSFLNEIIASGKYSESDITIFNSHIYSAQFMFILYRKMNSILNQKLFELNASIQNLPEQLPELSINIVGRTIDNNCDEAYNLIKMKNTILTVARSSMVTVEEGQYIIDEAIKNMAEIQYFENLPEYYKNEIDYLTIIRGNLKSETNEIHKVTNLHPQMFTGDSFLLWDHIMENYVTPYGKRGRLTDIAYYYWRMYLHKNQFIYQRPAPFKIWFQDIYKEPDILGDFKNPESLKSINRERNFSSALNWYKNRGNKK